MVMIHELQSENLICLFKLCYYVHTCIEESDQYRKPCKQTYLWYLLVYIVRKVVLYVPITCKYGNKGNEMVQYYV